MDGFEWDPAKAAANLRKHEVDFADAALMRKEYDFSKAKRGPAVAVPKGKTRITIRIDDDLLAWFKQQVNSAGGGNYQSLINTALREHMKHKVEPLEATLRRVLREELRTAS